MKILQLTNRIPYPLNDGGNLAVHFYTEGFHENGWEVTLLAMNTTRHWVEPESLPDLFRQIKHFQFVKVDNNIKAKDAFFNLFSSKSYNVSRFISDDYEKALIDLLNGNSYDVVQLEGLYLCPYIDTIRKYSQAKIVLRQHNAEFVIWERLAEKEQSFLKRQYLKLLARRLKVYEQSILNQVDFLLPISAVDAALFKKLGCHKPMMVQSYGVDVSTIPFLPSFSLPITLYHIGAMDWQPNQEGVKYFLEKVMPLVLAEVPNIQFHLAGRNMPAEFYDYQSDNIIVHGEVPDAVAFEKDKSILVVPLLSGGGVRIKIFKAMAMGKAIVSTVVGAEGIEIENGIQAFIADDAQDMANEILALINAPEKIEMMGIAARQLIQEKYNADTMIQELMKKYRELKSLC